MEIFYNRFLKIHFTINDHFAFRVPTIADSVSFNVIKPYLFDISCTDSKLLVPLGFYNTFFRNSLFSVSIISFPIFVHKSFFLLC